MKSGQKLAQMVKSTKYWGRRNKVHLPTESLKTAMETAVTVQWYRQNKCELQMAHELITIKSSPWSNGY